MKKQLFTILFLFISVLGGSILGGCGVVTSQSNVDIVTTLAPIEQLVASIAGPNVSVLSIVPSGVSPHDFEPTPRDIARIQNATVVFRIGNGFDDWMTPFLEGKRTILLSDGIADIVDERDPSIVNPHIWLSPKRVLQMIPRITRALETESSFNLPSEDLSQRSARVIQTFTEIDETYRLTINQLTHREIITVHEAWSYLAKDYGLVVAWTIEPIPGQEPSTQDILALRSVIQERNIGTIFSEPQLSQESINTIARDLGVQVLVLIPEGSDDIRTLDGVLRYNLMQISKGLS